MSIKAFALAAGIAVMSATSAAAATPIDPLNITAYSSAGGKLFTSIKSSTSFLGALTTAFNTSGFDDLFDSIKATYAGLENFPVILVSFKATKGSGDTSWTGQLAFNSSAKSLTFGSVTLLSPTELAIQAPVAVPGPEAGAGLGALLVGSLLLWTNRRRKSSAA
jgi:hypothetical protein